jgi:hypothetical protein
MRGEYEVKYDSINECNNGRQTLKQDKKRKQMKINMKGEG